MIVFDPLRKSPKTILVMLSLKEFENLNEWLVHGVLNTEQIDVENH